MKKIKCKLLGHKPSDYTYSGYDVCKRCGAHEAYDFDDGIWGYGGILLRPYYYGKAIYLHVKYKIKRWYDKYILKDDLPF